MRKIITMELAQKLDGQEIYNVSNLYKITTNTIKVNGKEVVTSVTVDGYRMENYDDTKIEWDEAISDELYIGDDVSNYHAYEWAQFI